MKFSMIFEGVDRASKVMKKLMATEKKMASTAKNGASKASRATAKTQRSNNTLNRSMNALKRSSGAAFRAVSRGANKAGRAIKDLHQKTVALGKRGFGSIKDGAGKIGRGVAVATGIFASIYGGAALAAGSMTDVASQFEKFQTILETTEGSSQKAKTAMSWVTDFAVKTPYELDKVMEGFVRMRANGLDPTNGSLKVLGDTAAGMGKPLMQAVEAMADAVTGENERLKEFGITASKNGKLITYEYTNALGKTVTASVKAGDRLAIQQTLMKIWGEKYGGAMEKLSQTWAGMVANMVDLWQKFQLMIMDAGLFDWMKGKLRLILDTITKMEADGSLKEWATQIGQSIQAALVGLWHFAVAAYSALQGFTSVLRTASQYVGGWKNLAIIIGAIAFAPTLIATATGLLMVAKGMLFLTTSVGGLVAGGGLRLLVGLLKANVAVYRLMGAAAMGAVSGVTALGRAIIFLSTSPLKGAVASVKGLWKALLGIPGTAAKAAASMKALAIATMGLPSRVMALSKAFLAMAVGSVRSLPGMMAGLARSFVMMAGAGLAALPGLLASAGTAMATFGAALMATPIGWFIAGVAAIAGGAYLIYQYWEPIKEFFGNLWAGVMDTGNKVVAWFGALDFSSYLPSISWDTILTALDWASWILPVRWLDFIPGFSWKEIFKTVLDWADFIPIPDFGAYFNFEWADILPDWDWGAIIPDMPDWIKPSNWFSGEDAKAPDLKLGSVAEAERMSQVVIGLEGDMKAVAGAASTISSSVNSAVQSAQSTLAGASFHHHGVRLMETLAAGMRARTQVVVEQIRATMQQVRNHLPSSPAKVGPLSDIHKLKFGETIAGSIKAGPMVKAMQAAAAATMVAASPALAGAQSGVSGSANAQPRSVAAIQKQAVTRNQTQKARGSGSTNITYSPTITISGDAKSAEGSFKRMLQEHKRDIKRMVDEETRREKRKEF